MTKAHQMLTVQVLKPLEVPVVDNYYLVFLNVFNSCDPVPFLRRAKCNKSDEKNIDYGSHTTSVIRDP